MRNLKNSLPTALIATLTLFVFIWMGTYTVEYLFSGPFPGFYFSVNNSKIIEIYSNNQAVDLQINDTILSMGGTPLDEYRINPKAHFFDGLEPGDSFPISVDRSGKQLDITWVYPGWTQNEFLARLQSQWWIAYAFLAIGVIALLFVNPKDELWGLFTAFNVLTGLWFLAGSGPAQLHLGQAVYVLRAGIWLSVPVLIHLHVKFPKPTGEEPTRLSKVLAGGMYLIGVGFLIRDMASPTLTNASSFGLIFGITASIILLIIHFTSRKEIREKIKIILRISLLALIPTAIAYVVSLFVHLPGNTSGGALIGLPLIPYSYLLVIWRGKLGRYEARVNKTIAVYIFFAFLFFGLLFVLNTLRSTIEDVTISLYIAPLLSVIVALLGTQVYPIFKPFVEKRLLDISVTATDIVQSFAAQITTTQDTAKLTSVLDDLILPSLLVRQSILVYFPIHEQPRVIYQNGVLGEQIPDRDTINRLLSKSNRYIPPSEMRSFPKEINWIRVVLPLRFDQNLIGVWMLGRRDPDDLYDNATIEMLNVLANQTSIAVINHQQTQQLRALYQSNIDRHEVERARLARYLHDETLNNLALLQHETQDFQISQDIDAIIGKLRKTIHGLRPEMLSYGLLTALEDLGDTLNERQSETQVKVALEGSPTQIESNIELHLFRIVQQACENTLRHARAGRLLISGSVEENAIHLEITDDGVGFDTNGPLRLAELLNQKHYGLAGMHERADLIGARIEVRSSPNQGTQIIIDWEK